MLCVQVCLMALQAASACCPCAAELFRRVLAAPILFFLRTPVGDVLNAFAREQVSCTPADTVATPQ
jgi:hypothetical protein